MNIFTLGFTGAYLDPVSSGYPLGDGYRWYLTNLMRFNARDNLSPFGESGVNPYAYCGADPINHSDPTGHMEVGDMGEFLERGLGDLTLSESKKTRFGRAIYKSSRKLKYYTLIFDVDQKSNKSHMIFPIKAEMNPYEKGGLAYAGKFPSFFGGTIDRNDADYVDAIEREVEEESRGTLRARGPFRLIHSGTDKKGSYSFYWTSDWSTPKVFFDSNGKMNMDSIGPWMLPAPNPYDPKTAEMEGMAVVDIEHFRSLGRDRRTILDRLIGLSVRGARGSRDQERDFLRSDTAEAFYQFIISALDRQLGS